MSSGVRVFLSTSRDSFIAGAYNYLSWPPTPDENPGEEYGYDAFMADIGHHHRMSHTRRRAGPR